MTAYNDELVDNKGRLVRPVLCNTAKDGSGTWYFALVDSDGHLQVDALSIAAGSNTIGKVNIKRVPVHTKTTGTGTAVATLTPSAAFKLLEIRFHLGGVLAATETLTVTQDATGAAYDTILLSEDMGTLGALDLVKTFGKDEGFFESSDSIVIALSANAGGDTWGCQTLHELV